MGADGAGDGEAGEVGVFGVGGCKKIGGNGGGAGVGKGAGCKGCGGGVAGVGVVGGTGAVVEEIAACLFEEVSRGKYGRMNGGKVEELPVNASSETDFEPLISLDLNNLEKMPLADFSCFGSL